MSLLEARPQATWTLPLEHLAASRPSPAKHKGDGCSMGWNTSGVGLKMVDIDHFDLIGNDDKTIMLEY